MTGMVEQAARLDNNTTAIIGPPDRVIKCIRGVMTESFKIDR